MINISKKILAIMVLAVFVLSIVPVAWAEEGQNMPQPQNQPAEDAPQGGEVKEKVNGGDFKPEFKQANQLPNQPANLPANQQGNKPLVNPMKGPQLKEGENLGEPEFGEEFEGELGEPKELQEGVQEGIKEKVSGDKGFFKAVPKFFNRFFGRDSQESLMPQPGNEPKVCLVEGKEVPCASENQAPLEVEPKKCWVDGKEMLCASEAKVTPELIERHRIFNQKFIEAREKHQQAKEQLVENRRELVQSKEKVSACDKEAGTCPEAKQQMFVSTQNHLVKTGDVMESSLEKLMNRVEDSKVLTDAEKEEAKTKISALDEKIKAKLDEIEALANGEINVAELRQKIKELKDLWQEVSKAQRWIVTQMINNKMENVVDKHLEYINGMEMRVADLEKKGAAPERIEALKAKVEEFKDEVAVLAKNQEAADKAWEASKGDVTKGTFTEAKDKQQDVREQLKVTKGMLREFIVIYKEVYKATVKTKELPPVAEGAEPVSEETPSSETSESAAEEASEAGEETAGEAEEETAEQASESASETGSDLATAEQ